MDFMDRAVVFWRWLRGAFERVAPPASVVLPWIGVVLLVIAAGFGVRSWRFARGRVRATATITENVSGFAKHGGVVYSPRFRFRAENGELVQVLARFDSDNIEFPAGETVPVLYRAGNPQGAVIATTWLAYQGAIVFGLLGTALFDLGWIFRLMLRQRTA